MKKSKSGNKKAGAEAKPKIIAVVGPTATGKSELAVHLAKKFGGEIISADSRQVYKGMNIGTGKFSRKEMRGIRHYLLDVASPKTANFNIIKFKKRAEKAISDILGREKVPIIAGGTGFWVDALAFNQNFPDVKPNPALRKKLEKFSAQTLHEMLRRMDPLRAKKIDAKNRRRLIRAIEIAESGLQFLDISKKSKPVYRTLFIGLDMPKKILEKKIRSRMESRFARGMANEVRRLHARGVSWKTLENFGLEYKFIAQFLRGKIGAAQMRELLFTAIKHYAGRQKTWLKRNQAINWLDARKKKSAFGKAEKLVKSFLF